MQHHAATQLIRMTAEEVLTVACAEYPIASRAIASQNMAGTYMHKGGRIRTFAGGGAA